MLDLKSIRAALMRPREQPAIEPEPVAAVAAILRDSPHGCEVLLIRRSEREHDPWSGHMAFPGGRREPSDATLLETAQRETLEEVGVDLRAHGALIGALEHVPTHRAGLVVASFVFELSQEVDLVPNREVAEALWAPLTPMRAGALDITYPYPHEGRTYPMPAYDVEGRIVWGLTYRMLRILFETIG